MAYTPQIYYPSNYQPYNAYAANSQQMSQNISNMQQYNNSSQLVGPPMGQPQQINQGLIWVQGETGAKSYLVAPNSTVLLMDSENEVFYIKMTDGAGMPTLRTFEYKERQNTTQNAIESPQGESKSLSEQFVTKDEYKSLLAKYEVLVEKVEKMQDSNLKNEKGDVIDE